MKSESARDFFLRARSGGSAHPSLTTGLPCFDDMQGSDPGGRSHGLLPGNVVEVYGRSGCGKSELVRHVLLSTILPQGEAGGAESDAVIFDNDWSFSIGRLRDQVEMVLSEIMSSSAEHDGAVGGNLGMRSAEQVDEDLEAAVTTCLGRVHVFRCQSSFQCLVSLHGLTELLENSRQPIRLLVFDSIASFHFQDKAVEHRGGGMMRMHLARTVAKLAQDYPLVVLATKPALFPPTSRSFHKEYLSKSWIGIVTHRVILQRDDMQPHGSPFTALTARVYKLKQQPLMASVAGGNNHRSHDNHDASMSAGGGTGGTGGTAGSIGAGPLYQFQVNENGLYMRGIPMYSRMPSERQ